MGEQNQGPCRPVQQRQQAAQPAQPWRSARPLVDAGVLCGRWCSSSSMLGTLGCVVLHSSAREPGAHVAAGLALGALGVHNHDAVLAASVLVLFCWWLETLVTTK